MSLKCNPSRIGSAIGLTHTNIWISHTVHCEVWWWNFYPAFTHFSRFYFQCWPASLLCIWKMKVNILKGRRLCYPFNYSAFKPFWVAPLSIWLGRQGIKPHPPHLDWDVLLHHRPWLGWQDSNLRMQQSKCCVLPLDDTPIFKPESWNRTNNVPQPSRNWTGWAITPLYHFSLSPYMQDSFFFVALPTRRFSKIRKMGLEPMIHKMWVCCMSLSLSYIYIISYFFEKIK